MFFRFLEFGNIGLLGSIFSSKTPYKFFKFLDLFSFVKSTCKKFAKKSGKRGKGFAKSKDVANQLSNTLKTKGSL